MKKKIKSLLNRLIMWASSDYLAALHKEHLALIRTDMHNARNHLAGENAKQWRLLNAQIAALQAIDAPSFGDRGKIVIIARVRNQDIVKIIDIATDMPQRDFINLVEELQARFSASPQFIDAPHAQSAFMCDALDMPSRRAVDRDRRCME